MAGRGARASPKRTSAIAVPAEGGAGDQSIGADFRFPRRHEERASDRAKADRSEQNAVDFGAAVDAAARYERKKRPVRAG